MMFSFYGIINNEIMRANLSFDGNICGYGYIRWRDALAF